MRIVLVDDDPERGDAIAVRLRAAGVTDIAWLAAGDALVAAIQVQSPDVVIIGVSRPDDDHLEIFRTLNREMPRPVVVFVDRDDPPFMDAAIEAGVSSYNVIGGALPEIAPVVRSAVAIFRRYRRLSETLATAEAKLGERAILQRAKLHLKGARGMSEPAAHRWLRRTAMNRGKRMVDVASELLAKAGEKKGDPDAA